MATKLPTRSQASVIAFFAGKPFPETRSNQTTYAACRTNGWIERTDEHPYHRTTTTGLDALAAYEQTQQPAAPSSVDVERVMQLVRAYGAECGRGDAMSDDAMEMLARIREAITGKEA